jgi:hypothetical protein
MKDYRLQNPIEKRDEMSTQQQQPQRRAASQECVPRMLGKETTSMSLSMSMISMRHRGHAQDRAGLADTAAVGVMRVPVMVVVS